MSACAFNYWQQGDQWLGYLDDHPDYLTQGESLEDLQAHLEALHEDFCAAEIQFSGSL